MIINTVFHFNTKHMSLLRSTSNHTAPCPVTSTITECEKKGNTVHQNRQKYLRRMNGIFTVDPLVFHPFSDIHHEYTVTQKLK